MCIRRERDWPPGRLPNIWLAGGSLSYLGGGVIAKKRRCIQQVWSCQRSFISPFLLGDVPRCAGCSSFGVSSLYRYLATAPRSAVAPAL